MTLEGEVSYRAHVLDAVRAWRCQLEHAGVSVVPVGPRVDRIRAKLIQLGHADAIDGKSDAYVLGFYSTVPPKASP